MRTSRLIAAAVLLLAACSEKEPGPQQSASTPPVLAASNVSLFAEPPGRADFVQGEAKQAREVTVYADAALGNEIAWGTVRRDGTFGPVEIGDNDWAQVWVVASNDAGSSEAIALHNDVEAPEVEVLARPAPRISTTTATFRFGCDEGPCTFECEVDGGSPGPCAADVVLQDLEAGNHGLFVSARDAAGNASEIVGVLWTVDLDGPSVSFTETPPSLGNEPTARFAFACDDDAGCSFGCILDEGEEIPCTSPRTFAVDDGAHEFTVRARDEAGNVAEVTHAFRVDTQAPSVTIAGAPDPYTASTSASFVFTCDEADCSFACSLDGASFGNCTIPAGWTNVADGSHQLAVHAIDPAGNVGEDTTFTWQVDTVDPVAVIDSGPPIATRAQDARFTFGCTGETRDCTFRCAFGTEALAPCTSPVERTGFPEAEHQFRVVAVDAAGNESDPAAATWSVDHTPPEVAWSYVPSNPSSDHYFGFEATANETIATWSCTFDGSAPFDCDRSYGRPGIPHGDHAIEIAATDLAGNVSTWARYEWFTDHEAPTVVIDAAPAQETTATDVSIAFSCDDPAGCTYRCGGDGRVPMPCTSPLDFTNLAPGDHRAIIIAADLAGNESEWREVTWRVRNVYAQASSGGAHACAVNPAGGLYCWGDNGYGQLGTGTLLDRTGPTQVAGLANWLSVSAGAAHNCGIRTDGSLWCWGRNDEAQLGIGAAGGPEATPFVVGAAADWTAVSAGGVVSCGLRGTGLLHCWGAAGSVGDGTGTQALTPQPIGTRTDWRSVSTGEAHACAIAADDTLWCWGANSHGQIGDGTTAAAPAPVQVAGSWSAVSAGAAHTCGVRTDGGLWCWGAGAAGQIGDGAAVDRAQPVAIDPARSFASVSAGARHSCARATSGQLFCWGENDRRQLGNGTVADAQVPVPVDAATDWAAVEAGEVHTCARKDDGSLHCWGDNTDGQLGLALTVDATAPTALATTEDPLATVAGLDHGCFVQNGGELHCWGDGSHFADGVPRDAPERIGTASDWGMIAAGASRHTCGIRGSGDLYCFGRGEAGQLGVGSNVDHATPQLVGTTGDWRSVATGGAHTCGVKTGGELWCWGDNGRGQLGDGTTISSNVPVRAGGTSDWVSVFAGSQQSCALKNDGTLWCWGANESAQLGDGSTSDQHSPVQIGSESDWLAVGLGVAHGCGVRLNGELLCWGTNGRGQIGDPFVSVQTTPLAISPWTDWQLVAVGELHSCAMRTYGLIYCWGANDMGQLGDGTTTDRDAITRIGLGMDWSQIAAGSGHTCGVRTDMHGSTGYCWGTNAEGRLGIGTIFRDEPTQTAF